MATQKSLGPIVIWRFPKQIRRWLLLTTLVLAVTTPLLMSSDVSAHAFLVQTVPQPGERLGANPRSIELQFSEPIAGDEQIAVKTTSGDPVDVGSIERLRDGLIVRTQLPPLKDGVYVVSWQVLASDGHLSLGEFGFAIGDSGDIPVAGSQSAQVAPWHETAVSWFVLVGLLISFGGLASEWLVWAPVASRHGMVIPRLPVGWLLVPTVMGGVLQVLFVAGQTADAGTAILNTRPGLLAVVQLALMAWSLWVLTFPLREARRSALFLLGFAIVTAAVRGHMGTSEHWWSTPANVVHLVAVAFWIGALGHLLLVVWRLRGDELRSVVGEGARRYAARALGLVGLVTISGVVVAFAQFSHPAELVDTRYGQVLLIKLLVVAAALALAYAARQRALPENSGLRLGLLRRLVSAEGALLLAVVAVAAVLANTAPPRSATATEDLLGPPPLEGPVLRQADLAGNLAVFVAAAEDHLQVRVLPWSGEPAPDTRVVIYGRAPDGTSFDVSPRRCGLGCVTAAFPWQEGTTTFTVIATAKEWQGDTVQFEIPWPPQPENPALLERVVETMRAQPEFTMTERVTNGPDISSEISARFTGERFVPLEVYAAGGASDIRPVPAPVGARALTFYISGSSMWYYLELDAQDRIQRETIVNPGRLIERTFVYDASESD